MKAYTLEFKERSGTDMSYTVISNEDMTPLEAIAYARTELSKRHLVGEHRLHFISIKPAEIAEPVL